MTPSLFDPSPSFDRTGLARRLAELAESRVYVGTSSWKYEGWLGQIYTPANYSVRGRYSRRQFEQECLREYAQIFPTVCGDFAFYQFPTPEFWQRLFDRVPDDFKFSFKTPEQITCKLFPSHERYGPLAGQENPSFLDAALFRESFLRELEPYRNKVSVLIFEFGTFPSRAFERVSDFLGELERFLDSLPAGFRYAVELRNPEFLAAEYFDRLRERNVAHVFNAWSRMPDIGRQLQIRGAMTADFVVSRALLRHGRSYEKAVEKFQPYAEVLDPTPETRTALRELIRRAREERREAYIYVNNRLEGNAPITISAIVEG